MPKNVEVKAKLRQFDRVLHVATELADSKPTLLNQEDTFFKVPHGRLKLRRFQDGTTSQLISYNRPDTEGPKVSDYHLCKIENHQDILQVLKSALGVVGVISKERHLLLCGQTRIHLDRVKNLGDFLELEVVLREDQGLEEGSKIAQDLLNKLGIGEEDLLLGSYIDFL